MNKSNSSTTTMRNIPPYAEEYVKSYLDRGNEIAFNAINDSFFTQYPEDTYAPLFQNEVDGINALAERGRNGSGIINKGKQVVSDIIDGDYLIGNKDEFQDMLTNATTRPSNTFESQIRSLLGGTLYNVGEISNENQAYNLTSAIASRYNARAASAIYKTNYDMERINQDDVLRQNVEYAKEDVKDAEWLRMAGVYYRVWLQGSHEDSYRKWFEGQNLEVYRVEVLGNTIRALVGTHSKKTTPIYRPNKAIGVIGGAMSGAATGAMLSNGNPYGIAIGAVVGGVMGYLSS